VVATGLLDWQLPQVSKAEGRVWAALITALFFVVFMTIAGHGITGLWRGVLIDGRNKISLSRFQLIVWTVIVLSGLTVAAVANAMNDPHPLNIAIPAELLAAIGISTTALVGSPLLLATKTSRAPNPDEFAQNTQILAQQQDAPPPVVAKGQVVANLDPRDAQWADMFRGEETGNYPQLDVGKIQMFYFTLVVAGVYGVALLQVLHGSAPVHAFPSLDQAMVALLGISQGAYLTNKVVPHSQQPNQPYVSPPG
jgi:hypothetical protein